MRPWLTIHCALLASAVAACGENKSTEQGTEATPPSTSGTTTQSTEQPPGQAPTETASTPSVVSPPQSTASNTGAPMTPQTPGTPQPEVMPGMNPGEPMPSMGPAVDPVPPTPDLPDVPDAGTPAPDDEGEDASAPNNPSPTPTECDTAEAPAVGALGLQAILSSTDLEGVSYARQPPNSDDWYLVEQRGRILVYADGALRPTPFFDVSSEVNVDPFYDERGLHSIEFALDYETSGLFYIVMTASAGPRENRDLILEYKRSEADPYVAETTETKTLLDLEGTNPNSLLANVHNAYQAMFGPDGYLYVGMGDGGGGCNDNAGFINLPQDLNSPIGKILRFDPSAPAPYAAPGNPFADSGDPLVYHLGVRNPFRFSWDSATGDMYFGDVGQDTHEEISVAPAGSAGLNFGWATWEGAEMVCNSRPLNTDVAAVVDPIFTTSHGQGNSGSFGAGCSASQFCDYSAIVGGAVYRGSGLPHMTGAYLFGDWVGDNMAALYHCEGQTSDVTSIDYEPDPNYPNNGYFVKVGDGVPDLASISAIVEGHDQELYLVANGNSLLKLVPAQ